MNFDVLVIGGGHAGTEAAAAAAKMGCRVGLVTLNASRIGFMSCNPAIGGLAKGHLVKEIDALGGLMGWMADRSAIQYRRLNQSKGPAVRSSRAQCDKALYAQNMQEYLATVKNLTILEAEVSEILVSDGEVVGVQTSKGEKWNCRSVVVTSGTFMHAIMHTGESKLEGGRLGDAASKGLSGCLSELGFRLRRLKTGTPPRLHRRSIDFSRLEEQRGDAVPRAFSFFRAPNPFPYLPQISCYLTYTNAKCHEIIAENFHRAPMFTGQIEGVGPRYCPSIEDKVSRFRDRSRHQLFLEPEGLTTDEVYVNGISTSLPRDVQDQFVRSIEGLESAEFVRYGYAVEYDAIDARQLKRSLESKEVGGLFVAGQVNGTSGYEEAGAQGLLAGINAALRVKDEEPFILERGDGYTGVLIDDLTLQGSDEPYRMFTSRAEYRLLLREDNADQRLLPMARKLGLIDDDVFKAFEAKSSERIRVRKALDDFYVFPVEQCDFWFQERGFRPLLDRASGADLLKRPEFSLAHLRDLGFDLDAHSMEAAEQAEIEIRYAGYIQRDLDLLDGVRKSESVEIPLDLDFHSIPGLSNEVRAKLAVVRPENLGQISRIQGVTPAAAANLMIYLKMRSSQGKNQAYKSPRQLRKEKISAWRESGGGVTQSV